MSLFESTPAKTPSKPTEPRFGLSVWVLPLIIAFMLVGFWGVREYFSPVRVWRRAIHDPSRVAKAWLEVEREHLIDGLDSAGTLREVFEAMTDPDPLIRGFAVASLPTLQGDPVLIIDHLTRRLGDSDPAIRIKTTEALGQIYKREKPGRTEALRALEVALKETDPRVRKAAIGSIGQVVYEGGPATDPLRSRQKDDPALNLIAERLQDDDMAVRIEAAFVLACNDRGGDSVPMLVKFLNEQPVDQPMNYLANRAFMAMTILAVRSDAAVAFLAGELAVPRESYPDRPRDALAWAARQDPNAHLAVRKRAREALKSKDHSLRLQGAFLLHDIGLGIEALDVLVDAVQDQSLDIRIRAVEAIGDIGEADVRAMTALQKAANDPEIEIRERALGALEAIEIEKMQ